MRCDAMRCEVPRTSAEIGTIVRDAIHGAVAKAKCAKAISEA